MTEKSKELVSSIKLVNDKLNFIGNTGNNEPISIDYIPPLGDNLGYTSLELLLLSLTSCLGSSILTFLRKMNKTIKNFEIKSKGLRKEEHPTGFKEIHIEIKLESENTEEKELRKVIQMSETYCPVLDMVKGNVQTIISFEIY